MDRNFGRVLKELKPYRDELDEEQKTAVYHIEKIFNKYHAKTKKGIHINIKKIKTVETSKSENKKELSEKQESLGSVAELGTGTKKYKIFNRKSNGREKILGTRQ